MSTQSIGDKEAAEEYGITTSHELMENGEVRFRLVSNDGSSYIRTDTTHASDSEGFGWQNAHYHKRSRETYVVESGLMILASRSSDGTHFESLTAGSIVSTAPYVSHNVHLGKDSVIHTIKSSEYSHPDWFPDRELDAETKSLSEEEAMEMARNQMQVSKYDPRHTAYMSLYSNFDNIIWRMPPLLIGGVTLLVGFAIGLLGDGGGGASALVWGSVLASSSLILFLGAYGLWRLRIHQNLVGDELRKMEPNGYFHQREVTRATFLLPRAPALFVFVFFVLSLALMVASVGVFNGSERLHEVLQISQ